MNVLDMIGPVMIGPSSSHTAGAVRIGQAAAAILGSRPAEAELLLSGSFADTGRGHGTDRALVAGLLGMAPDDARIPDSFSLARQRGLRFSFSCGELPQAHPNSVRIREKDAAGRQLEVQASSVGGGAIRIDRLDGIEVGFDCELETLVAVHQDSVGLIAELTRILAAHRVNIASIRCSRTGRGRRAVTVIEVDGGVDDACLRELAAAPQGCRCIRIPRLEG